MTMSIGRDLSDHVSKVESIVCVCLITYLVLYVESRALSQQLHSHSVARAA